MSEYQWVERQMRAVLEMKLLKPWALRWSKTCMEADGKQLLVTPGSSSVRFSEGPYSLTMRNQCRTGENNRKASTGKQDFMFHVHDFFFFLVYLNS